MQAVILAGGLGTRLKPITEKIPKPMVSVAGKPFLYWQLMDLKQQGFTQVLLLVAYRGEQIQAHFGDGRDLGLRIRYSFEPEPLGTGGALKNADSLLEERFLLLNGDSFLRAPLQEMIYFFEQRELDALVSTYDNRIPSPVIPNLRVQDDLVLEYKREGGVEAGFHYIDSGIYVLNKEILAGPKPARFQIENLWFDLIRKKTFGAFLVPERFYDIGTPERLKEFEDKVRDYF